MHKGQPDKDSVESVARVLTSRGVVTRPAAKLIILPNNGTGPPVYSIYWSIIGPPYCLFCILCIITIITLRYLLTHPQYNYIYYFIVLITVQ